MRSVTFTESLTRDNIPDYEEEILGSEGNNVGQQKKPKRTIHAISDVDRVPTFDPDGAAHVLCLFCFRDTDIPLAFV